VLDLADTADTAFLNKNQTLGDGNTVKKSRGQRKAQGEAGIPLDWTYFFQELQQDIQQVVLEGIRFPVTFNDMWRDLEDRFIDLELLRDEIADDRINRNNARRTIKEWLAFAETGA
jgi:hypothetical protein